MAVGEGVITGGSISKWKGTPSNPIAQNYLPDMLTSNSTIYGIISKGIHELSEDDCITYFPVLQECIFLWFLKSGIKQKKKKAAAQRKKNVLIVWSKIAQAKK